MQENYKCKSENVEIILLCFLTFSLSLAFALNVYNHNGNLCSERLDFEVLKGNQNRWQTKCTAYHKHQLFSEIVIIIYSDAGIHFICGCVTISTFGFNSFEIKTFVPQFGS